MNKNQIYFKRNTFKIVTEKLISIIIFSYINSRAQEMIQALDKDINDLKIVNRDLQKDMESCRERESKMLTLQSELSRSNALLRSENSNLNNKVKHFVYNFLTNSFIFLKILFY